MYNKARTQAISIAARQSVMTTDHQTPIAQSDSDAIIAATRHWLEKAVIGLNLCPFAKAVHVKNQIRYAVSVADTAEALQCDLVRELALLRDTDPNVLDTTLLIHPFVLTDFLDYNDFLDVADATLVDMKLDGQIQIASFHPHYQFAGSQLDDIANYTNRSPYPILHLLRETSIDRAIAAFPDASDIFNKNIETMQALGHHGWSKLHIQTANANAAESFNKPQKN